MKDLFVICMSGIIFFIGGIAVGFHQSPKYTEIKTETVTEIIYIEEKARQCIRRHGEFYAHTSYDREFGGQKLRMWCQGTKPIFEIEVRIDPS